MRNSTGEILRETHCGGEADVMHGILIGNMCIWTTQPYKTDPKALPLTVMTQRNRPMLKLNVNMQTISAIQLVKLWSRGDDNFTIDWRLQCVLIVRVFRDPIKPPYNHHLRFEHSIWPQWTANTLFTCMHLAWGGRQMQNELLVSICINFFFHCSIKFVRNCVTRRFCLCAPPMVFVASCADIWNELYCVCVRVFFLVSVLLWIFSLFGYPNFNCFVSFVMQNRLLSHHSFY